MVRRPSRQAGRKAAKTPPAPRRWLRRLLIAVLAGPALVLLAYRFVPPPATPLMAIRVLQAEGMDYRWRSLEAISPHLARAVIASEDNRFCRHWGFDAREILNSLEDWRGGARLRGASTLSMQTAKNVLLWPGRDYLRKAIEAWLTPQIELLWGKRRILEVYLNIAEMGPGIYGAEAAARHHFGKSAADLTLREASLLAAALPNPRQRSAGKPGPKMQKQARTVRRRIAQLGSLLDCAP